MLQGEHSAILSTFIKIFVLSVLSGRFHKLNAGQKYCRMLQGEHSAILSTFMKIFVLSIFSGRFTQVLLYRTCLLSISDFVLVARCHIIICTAKLCV